MSLKDLPTTITWTYTEIALKGLLCAVASILLIVELTTTYLEVYGGQNAAKLAELQRTGTDSGGSPPSSTSDITTNNTQQHKKKSPMYWILHIMPLLMYACYLANGISSILFKLGIAGFEGCTPCGVQGALFALGKMLMYLIFIYRLYAVYSQSVFQYNTRILTTMAVICIVYSTAGWCINQLTVTSYSITIDNDTFCVCISIAAMPALIVLFDTIISVLCCYLFVRPIRALNMLHQDKDPELYAMLQKYVVLTFVAVISTFICIIVIILLKLNGVITIDAIINCVCIFLFNSKYDAVFKVLCCGARKCGSKAVDSCCSKK